MQNTITGYHPVVFIFFLMVLTLTYLGFGLFGNAIAADFLPPLPLDRPVDNKLDTEIPTPTIPPKITLPPIKPRQTDRPSTKDLLHFTASKFEFRDNTIFSNLELAALIQSFKDTPINALDLEELRLIITNYYINHGYINSGALIPDQELSNGTLIIKITEGTLSQYNISTDGRLSVSYIKDRILFPKNSPFHLVSLQNKLLFLQQNPLVKRINSTLLPSQRRGEGILNLEVTEEKAYSVDLEFNNHRPPSIDEKQTLLTFKHINLSGKGDSITARYHHTKGLDGGSLDYEYPITAYDSEIIMGVTQNDSLVTFANSEIDNASKTAYLGFKSPLIKSINQRYDIDIKLEYKSNESKIDDEKGLTANCEDERKIKVSTLRLGQSWQKYDPKEIFSFRHTMSVGVKAFNALECPGSEPDSRYTSWLFQYLWAKRYSTYKIQTIFKGNFQFAMNPLLSSEKYSIGGANSVRGYSENQIVRDNGRFLSFELRIPIFRKSSSQSQTEALIFYDTGQAWNNVVSIQPVDKSKDQETVPKGKESISSVGSGIRWRYQNKYTAELIWAHQIQEKPDIENSLQENGIHFRVSANLL